MKHLTAITLVSSLAVALMLVPYESRAVEDHSNHAGMQDVKAQGGTPPENARDPHAYSGGYTLTEGPYSLAAKDSLKLADEHAFWAIAGNRFEFDPDNDATTYDVQAWYGTTFNRFVVKAEGDFTKSNLQESQTDLLFSRAFAPYWDLQAGVRVDIFDEGKNRNWLAFGIQGLAPYWFELDVTGYLSSSGRAAITAEVEYELLLTQKLILQPRAEVVMFSKDDLQNGTGSGLSNSSLGLRMRYEFTRQFAPYIGIERVNTYGQTSDLARTEGEATSDTVFLAGLRFWF
tara:strand:+ start:18773 stop:19636 length:864 start_codon:yes stop_codon:yes gene_type:complete